MKPPVCRACGKAEFFHTCAGPAAGAQLAARGMVPATEAPKEKPPVTKKGKSVIRASPAVQAEPSGKNTRTKI